MSHDSVSTKRKSRDASPETFDQSANVQSSQEHQPSASTILWSTGIIMRKTTHLYRMPRHELFWLEDGNITLEASGILFRVHRSWLVRHSELFATIFNDEGKHIGYDTVTGIDADEQLYQLTKLEEKDLEALLLFYDNPVAYRGDIRFSTLVSLIRATTILGFEADRVWAVELLTDDWPSDLESLHAGSELRSNAAQVAALSRACGINGILKPAFYEMARTSGFGLDDVDEFSNSEQISRADERRLMRMREQLSGIWMQAAAREDPSLACPNRVNDHSSDILDKKPELSSPALGPKRLCEAWVRLVHDSGIYDRYRHDPLCGLSALMLISWKDEGWCKGCHHKRRRVWSTIREKTWEQIDGWMCIGQ
ncbi:hypothetical protein F4604DRAFT_1715938 [Suillus subluteus]|nr:hypothetical protein F4604DRAFT_1715938 [Suillus subluteus]